MSQTKEELLKSISFGERVAEQEVDNLSSYFVETAQWRKIYSGDVDIVYGPKGAGKSALYSLLAAREKDLLDRHILIVPAENPTGTTAFAEIKTEPPTSEHEFTGLWKLYFACLIAQQLRAHNLESEEAQELCKKLEQAELMTKKVTLRSILLAAKDYSKRLVEAESIEGGLGFDPITGVPVGLKGKITFREPSQQLKEKGLVSVDALLEKANEALAINDMNMWLLLDRLDVAFEQSEELEHNALRALFRAYLDMVPLDNIHLKVFLRTDIWRRITDGGFREASHITRHLTIKWQRQSLLNLVVKRLLVNNTLVEHYELDPEEVLGDIQAQENILKRIMPDQVDTGKNPSTFDWMLSRTQDGTKQNTPRELIHLLSSLQEVQARRFELGHEEPHEELLFDRASFKEALKAVSEERLTKTVYAEEDVLKRYIEKMEGEKTQQNPATLARIWEVSTKDARDIADRLIAIGFFESRGSKHDPIYWVPFLYRDALSMVQGEAK